MSAFILQRKGKSLYYVKKGSVFTIRYKSKKKQTMQLQSVKGSSTPYQTSYEYMQYLKQGKNNDYATVQSGYTKYNQQTQADEVNLARLNKMNLLKKFNMSSAWNSGIQQKNYATVFQNKILAQTLIRQGTSTTHKKSSQMKNRKLNTWVALNHSPTNRKSQISSMKNENKKNQNRISDITLFKGLVAFQCPIINQILPQKKKYGSNSFIR